MYFPKKWTYRQSRNVIDKNLRRQHHIKTRQKGDLKRQPRKGPIWMYTTIISYYIGLHEDHTPWHPENPVTIFVKYFVFRVYVWTIRNNSFTSPCRQCELSLSDNNCCFWGRATDVHVHTLRTTRSACRGIVGLLVGPSKTTYRREFKTSSKENRKGGGSFNQCRRTV